MTWLCFLGENLVHGRKYFVPVGLFFEQLGAAGTCQRVDFCAASILELTPFAFDPTLFSQTVESGEKRTGPNHKHAAGDALDAVGNADAVKRAELEGTEDQEIEGALQEVGFCHKEECNDRPGSLSYSMISNVDIVCQ